MAALPRKYQCLQQFLLPSIDQDEYEASAAVEVDIPSGGKVNIEAGQAVLDNVMFRAD